MNRIVIAALVATSLAGCAGAVQSKVDAAVVGLTTTERLALVYTGLPRCPAAGPCSDQATVNRIKALDQQAYQAVKAAEQNEALLNAALASIATLQSAIPAAK